MSKHVETIPRMSDRPTQLFKLQGDLGRQIQTLALGLSLLWIFYSTFFLRFNDLPLERQRDNS
jgi:hypothetical protein